MRITTALIFCALAGNSAIASERMYEVTITNITKGQTFTPILAATHTADVHYFMLGTPASASIATLAESGNPAPLESDLQSLPDQVGDTDNSAQLLENGLLLPGQSVTLELDASRAYPYLSMAAMLIPTNDTFMAIDAAMLPRRGHSATFYAYAFDAGSEANDELCMNVPGPVCGGAGESAAADSDEGYVFISQGIHGEGDLASSGYDWRGPVAKVDVRFK